MWINSLLMLVKWFTWLTSSILLVADFGHSKRHQFYASSASPSWLQFNYIHGAQAFWSILGSSTIIFIVASAHWHSLDSHKSSFLPIKALPPPQYLDVVQPRRILQNARTRSFNHRLFASQESPSRKGGSAFFEENCLSCQAHYASEELEGWHSGGVLPWPKKSSRWVNPWTWRERC